MQFNLFSWIREGVKQSVILGVSDAVDAIGTPHGEDDVKERLSLLLQPAGGGDAEPALAGTAKRKRLGRSLRDLETGT
jgi:hypothetical protein